jgi:hypothetical protein
MFLFGLVLRKLSHSGFLQVISNSDMSYDPISGLHILKFDAFRGNGGKNMPIRVELGDQRSAPVLFSFDPPLIRGVNSLEPDAAGTMIVVTGICLRS